MEDVTFVNCIILLVYFVDRMVIETIKDIYDIEIFIQRFRKDQFICMVYQTILDLKPTSVTTEA